MVGLILLSVLGLGIIFIAIFFRHVYNSTHKKPVFNAKQSGQIAFYEKCLEQNIHDLKTWSNFQKAQKITEDLNLTNDWVDMHANPETAFNEYFEEAQKLYMDNSDIIKQNKLEERREAEQEQEKQLTKYADCAGTYKRIAMLSDLERQYDAGARLLHEYSISMVRGSQQQTCNWAIIGGLVSGLAGGAAGVAAAVDVQMRNAEINAQNAQNIARIANNLCEVDALASRLRSKADALHGEIYEAERKSVYEISEDTVMALLEFENSCIEVLETGNISISVTVKYRRHPAPIDGKSMVVDGTIAAEIYQDGAHIKTALLVLPAYGLTVDCDLKTLCCAEADVSKAYEVRYVPYNLWLMEA